MRTLVSDAGAGAPARCPPPGIPWRWSTLLSITSTSPIVTTMSARLSTRETSKATWTSRSKVRRRWSPSFANTAASSATPRRDDRGGREATRGTLNARVLRARGRELRTCPQAPTLHAPSAMRRRMSASIRCSSRSQTVSSRAVRSTCTTDHCDTRSANAVSHPAVAVACAQTPEPARDDATGPPGARSTPRTRGETALRRGRRGVASSSTIQKTRGTWPDDGLPTDSRSTVATPGAMEDDMPSLPSAGPDPERVRLSRGIFDWWPFADVSTR